MLIIFIVLSYVIIGFIIGGFIYGVVKDDFNPLPVFGGAFWPIAIIFFIIFPLVRKASNFGKNYSNKYNL